MKTKMTPTSFMVDWADIGSIKAKKSAKEVFHLLGKAPEVREGLWGQIVLDQGEERIRNLIVLTALSRCAAKFQSVQTYQWTAAIRAANAYLVVFVRNLQDQRYASLVDDIVQASQNRVVVHSVGKLERRVLESSISQALTAMEPQSVIDARYSKDTESLWLEFGDGKTAILPWAALGLADLQPRLRPSTVVPSDDRSSLQVLRSDGGVFDIDAAVLRASVDKRLADRISANAKKVAGQVGLHLREKRRQRSLTQTELASRSNLDQALISRVEQGKHQPGLTTLSKYARGLGLSVSELLE